MLLGTGSGVPSSRKQNKPFRSYAGWYIEVDSESIIFDIGVGVTHKMLLSGIDILLKPTHVFITHHHLDHTSDLFQLMLGRCFAKRNRKVAKLHIIAPPSFITILHTIWEIYGEGFSLEENFEIKEAVEGFSYKTENFEVIASSIKHTEDSVCYRLNVNDNSIIYSGDMGYDEQICEAGKDADIAILECSFPDKPSVIKNHLCPEDIGKLSKKGNFKKVVLTHMFPECEGKEEEMKKKIKDLVNIDVIVGEDMLRIDF